VRGRNVDAPECTRMHHDALDPGMPRPTFSRAAGASVTSGRYFVPNFRSGLLAVFCANDSLSQNQSVPPDRSSTRPSARLAGAPYQRLRHLSSLGGLGGNLGPLFSHHGYGGNRRKLRHDPQTEASCRFDNDRHATPCLRPQYQFRYRP
jgi:hypothetical protein